MSNYLLTIDKLTKDNYDTWHLQMKAMLIKTDHWGYVNGTIAKPEENAAEVAAWSKEDAKAQADIILSMSPSELCHIKNCDTSTEIWTKLSNVYASKGSARDKITLLKQLLFTKMERDDDIMGHIHAFSNTVDKLEEMDVKIQNDVLTILLLYSIPDTYEDFRCAIESRDVLPDYEALKIKLIEENKVRRAKKRKQQAQYRSNKQQAQYIIAAKMIS